MSDAHAAVLTFIEDFWRWREPLAADDDLFDVLGIEGDDAGEFIDAFAARFDVDVTAYRWYFHHAEEGWNYGALVFRPPYRRVGRIPITLAVLTEAVRTKHWPIDYPAHVLPRRRWDILINRIFAAGALIALAAWAWMRFLG
ncbi:DUF1493 family protein [Brevundimonas sp.]|uniref:DUF1493 family protein n=1 Tax=Brevundimonas sp. TaxID=1871086 RepID=UPI002EDA73B7